MILVILVILFISSNTERLRYNINHILYSYALKIVKELHLKVASDEAGNRASQPRNSFSLNKSKLLHMNAIWKRQYSEANTQRVRVDPFNSLFVLKNYNRLLSWVQINHLGKKSSAA